ncbi:MAG: hypothetical protein BroJett011_17240 [Chloroflexota bacterium]|nr:MAG: hypothetical protein BroJett011_17240 [Chloroflexota bacterium]
MLEEVRLSRRQAEIIHEPGVTELDRQCRLLGPIGVNTIFEGFLDEHTPDFSTSVLFNQLFHLGGTESRLDYQTF